MLLPLVNPAVEIIEKAKEYLLLSNERYTYPVFVGNRKKLELVLRNVDASMVIATTGDLDRCIVLIDYDLKQVKKMVKERQNES